MIQESNASHFTGVGATSNSDHRLSSMISIETPSIHHTPVDCSEVMSTPEDRAPSNRHILFDLESAKPRIARSESGNPHQLVQPLYDFLAYPLLSVDLCGLGWTLQIQSLKLLSAAYTHVVAPLSGSFSLHVLVYGDGITPGNLPENYDRHILIAFIVDFAMVP